MTTFDIRTLVKRWDGQKITEPGIYSGIPLEGEGLSYHGDICDGVAVSSSFLADHPDVAAPLNALMAALTTENLTQLNEKVDVERQKPEDVAAQFLSDNGLS